MGAAEQLESSSTLLGDDCAAALWTDATMAASTSAVSGLSGATCV